MAFTLTPVSTTFSEDVGSIIFTVTRSSGVGSETVVFSTLRNLGFDNVGDYTGILNRSLIFSAGVTTQTVSVSITNDSLVESTETFGAIIESLLCCDRRGFSAVSARIGAGSTVTVDPRGSGSPSLCRWGASRVRCKLPSHPVRHDVRRWTASVVGRQLSDL